MKMSHKLAAMAAVTVALFGCSDDDNGTGSGGAFTEYERVAALPPQVATISIADPLGSPTVTITQADSIDLEGNATTNGTDTVTINLSMMNNTGRLLFNPKVVPTALNQGIPGTNTINQTGTIHPDAEDLANMEYYGFGIRALEEGVFQLNEHPVMINGVDGMVDPLVVQVEIPTNHSMAYHNSSSWGRIAHIDILGQRNVDEDYDQLGENGAYLDSNNYHQGAQTPDGRYLFMGNRNLPSIIKYDTTTDVQNNNNPELMQIPIHETAGEIGFVGHVTMSPNGQYLYASYIKGAHEYSMHNSGKWGGNGYENFLLKVDVTSETVVARLPIPPLEGREVYPFRARTLSISEDGSRGSLAMDFIGGIAIIDLEDNMEILETFDTIADGYGGPRLSHTAMSPDGTHVYYPDSSDEYSDEFSDDYEGTDDIVVLDINSGTYSKILVLDEIFDEPHQLEFGPDGRLYHAGDNDQINVYDVDTMTHIAVLDNTSYSMFAFDAEGEYLIAFGSDTDVYDLSDYSFTGVFNGDNSDHGFAFVSPY